MKIIDAHIHFSNVDVLKKTAQEISHLEYSSNGLKSEFEESNVVLGIGMGLNEVKKGAFPCKEASNPMILDLEEKIPDRIVCCVGINPFNLEGDKKDEQLSKIENELQKKNVVGIKIYAGYYHYYVYDKIYEPVYELASNYNLPVVIHSGDTYSERGLLKYSHPLTVDELAVTHRDINFVIAHMGCPWIMDAAEVTYKNENVFADISGIIVEDNALDQCLDEPLFLDHIKRGLIYTGFEKYFFGSDWPLIKIKPFVEFAKKIVPEKYHREFFYENAVTVFPKIKNIINKLHL